MESRDTINEYAVVREFFVFLPKFKLNSETQIPESNSTAPQLARSFLFLQEIPDTGYREILSGDSKNGPEASTCNFHVQNWINS